MATRADKAEEPYLTALARAAAGALIFGFPLLMTMEMWELGFHMGRLRLALFVVVTAAVVFGLARFAGFRNETSLADDALDTLAALLVGFVVSALLLWVFGLLGPQTGLREAVGMIAVQAAPASMGAVLANKQLQEGAVRTPAEDRAGYAGELFLMTAGALFLAFNVAPTEEMILIGFKMSPWHAAALILLSLTTLHALVFTVGFAGQHGHEGHLRAFLHFTLAGYGLALLVSVYVLWTFGRFESGLSEAVRAVVVLGFPSAVGAAIARLVV
ncbi:MAG: TIGR02587 family membrane protein [Phenylobacterium sp.]|uniref:TIGR02587 family membrane protein n=1 Tax=Phenylobacterium sp. TaxID=1871053 RepID=UPI001A5AE406|nr:TIGR02587 family membrane protein [Phenylobacterium sp.]MBL8771874.1 TIGR02587 family membrane protein [Phenylobacterium sp.]